MKKTRGVKAGVSLAEVIVALAILGIVAVPVFWGFSHGAADELNYDKVAEANKILEAFKSEIKNLSYAYAEDIVDKGGTFTGIDAAPNTFKALLEAQQKYKDFEFEGTAKKVDSAGGEAIQFTATVSWTKQGKQKSEETIFFIKAK